MKIGILTYHSACNYGANLQILSTIGYLEKLGHIPRVINYEAIDFVSFYAKTTSEVVRNLYKDFRMKNMPLTKHCSTVKDIANVLKEENIEAVIVGSDAVAQHHTLRERVAFPCRTIVGLRKVTSDRMFPNPFWGTFLDYMPGIIPMAIMSVSSQDSNFNYFSSSLKEKMWMRLKMFRYKSVRDEWTKRMYEVISDGKCIPSVTPDPVFAFNQNVSRLIPDRELILEKYKLPERYILLSFKNSRCVPLKWISEFDLIAKRNGFVCVALPFPQGLLFKHNLEYSISEPLAPIDWYALIKYSSGYVGHNMHPIVVSLHNNIPFFSFDNYGLSKYRGMYVDETSSKIYHILSVAGFLKNRISCVKADYNAPDVFDVWNALMNFDKAKCSEFSNSYYSLYVKMMNDILNAFL